MQIQRYMARNDKNVTAFVRFHGVIQREFVHILEYKESLLEVRNGILYVRALDEPLVHVDSKLRFALDETTIVPDSPLLRAYTTSNQTPIAKGKASIWTLLPALSGNGSAIATILLQRCLSVPLDMVKFTSSHGVYLGASEYAQTDDLWYEFAKIWLPRCGASWENSGFVYLDCHSTNLTRRFIELVRYPFM